MITYALVEEGDGDTAGNPAQAVLGAVLGARKPLPPEVLCLRQRRKMVC